MTRPDEIISASEIGQWTYCNRAWYLAHLGEVSQNAEEMIRGEAHHQRHSRGVARTQMLYRLAMIFIALGIALIVAAAVVTLLP